MMPGIHTRALSGHFATMVQRVPVLAKPADEQGIHEINEIAQAGPLLLAHSVLLAQTHWGGFLSSDAVTLSWGDEEPCLCGRSGPYVHSEIRRYSDIEGGDDKVTCAGAPEAHDKALAFLNELG
jgi:hypothetical protein